MTLNKHIDPYTLFSQYFKGSKTDSLTDLKPAKWITASIGATDCLASLNIFRRNSLSLISPFSKNRFFSRLILSPTINLILFKVDIELDNLLNNRNSFFDVFLFVTNKGMSECLNNISSM